MAYEMLTGKLPFEATTPWQWATEHMTSQPRPFETMAVSTSIPKPMRDAILRGLAKDRDERFDTVSAFVDAMAADDSALPASADSGRGSAATAAMEAAPDFGASTGGQAPTAAMPAQAPMAAPAVAAQRIPAPPPGGRSAAGGGNKGLIFGLGGVAVLLLGGLAYALMQNGDNGGEVDPLIPTDTPTVADTVPAPTAEPEPSDEQGSAGAAGEGGSGGDSLPPITGGGGETRPVRPPSTSRPPTTPSPPSTPQPSDPTPSGDPCTECASLAQGGNITGAAAKFQQCSDAAKKSACSARAKRRAPAAAKAARSRQNCAKAKQIQAAANSMSAGSTALDGEVSQCN
jgi:serine/threonine-protein kinase